MYSIKVAFCQEIEPDFISRAIMRFERTNYSHVFVIFEDVDTKQKILHSVGGGTCIDHEMEYLKTHKIVRQYEVPMKVDAEVFSAYARGREGHEYSESQYINQILRLLGISWQPIQNGNSKAICSEEVSRALNLADLDSSLIDVELVSPRMVDEFLSGQKKARLIT